MRIKKFIIGLFLLLLVTGSASAQEDCPKALTLVKKAHVAAFSRDEVKIGLEEAIKLCPHMVEAIYEFGRFYYQEGKFTEAEQKFKEADSLKPRVEHSLGIALSQCGRKDYASAENTYKQALTTYLGHWSLLEGLAVLYIDMSKFVEAEELLRQALQSESQVDSIYYNLGLVLEKLGRTEEAQVSFKTALEKSEKSTPASLALMRIYLRNDNSSEALRVGQKALLHAPLNENLLFALADVYSNMGEFSDARRELMKISSPGNELKKKVNLELLDLRSSSGSKSIGNLKILMKEHPDSVDVLRGLGLALAFNKEYLEAEKILQSALQISSNDPVILNNLGTVYEGMGQIDKAKDFYLRAQTLAGFKIIQDNMERLK